MTECLHILDHQSCCHMHFSIKSKLKQEIIVIPQTTASITNQHLHSLSILYFLPTASLPPLPPPPLHYSLTDVTQLGMWLPVPVVRRGRGGTEGGDAATGEAPGEAPAGAGEQGGASAP